MGFNKQELISKIDIMNTTVQDLKQEILNKYIPVKVVCRVGAGYLKFTIFEGRWQFVYEWRLLDESISWENLSLKLKIKIYKSDTFQKLVDKIRKRNIEMLESFNETN
jgi:hypothetical protein